MDITPFINSISAVVATGTFVVGAVSAKRSWDEKRRELERTRMERRQAEVHRLMAEFGKVSKTFNDIFDYESRIDAHLRVQNLMFLPEEQATRTRVDEAFEHLRDLCRSLKLGLITPDDLSFWTYWIHRVPHRPALREYARACGYDSFLRPLQQASATDPQLVELRRHSPWWPKDGTAASGGRVRVDAREHGASSPTTLADVGDQTEGALSERPTRNETADGA